MSIFDFKDSDALGTVQSVDTGNVVVRVADIERLRQLQVNRLAVLQSSRPGQHLIGIILKITRSIVEKRINDASPDDDTDSENETAYESNLVKIALIGTLVDRSGERQNIFLRTLETVPEIDANCFPIEGDRLTNFMRVVASVEGDGARLSLGKYTLDDRAEAYINGNKLFQRHAIIVGSTGSGKSWTTARLLEQVAALPNANAIVFDIHGEYGSLNGAGFRRFRVAGTTDLATQDKSLEKGVLFLPFWLLSYEAMVAMFVDRSDQNAPNQAMVMSRAITTAKRAYLEAGKHQDVLDNFTIDSPVPFPIDDVVKELEKLNTEMVAGARAEKQGDFHGKLSRLIQRLENKRTDRRLGFLFQPGKETDDFKWLIDLAKALVGAAHEHDSAGSGVKIIDFSEVPSDILPLIVSVVAKLAFSVQQWTGYGKRHPIALFCDEAHLYIPERGSAGGAGEVSLDIFERIAKEGRKYGVGLVVISQRPSEVNRTVLSQCNNLIAMRLTNGEDQNVVKKLLPDSLGGFGDLLPILDTGEALVVGDASLLPSRIRITKPTNKPNSGTIDFWDIWAGEKPTAVIESAVDGWRKQTLQSRTEK